MICIMMQYHMNDWCQVFNSCKVNMGLSADAQVKVFTYIHRFLFNPNNIIQMVCRFEQKKLIKGKLERIKQNCRMQSAKC